jgi:hypothetical protein
MKLPFWMLPGSWGLKGKTRKIAEAEYYYSGIELEKELFILNNDMGIIDNTLEILKFDLQLNLLTKEQYREKIKLFLKNDKKLLEYQLLWQLEDEDIDQDTYELELANLKQEPFMKMLDSNFDNKKGLDGLQLKLIWNEYFIEYLRLNGYVGTEEHIVSQYINDIMSETVPVDF